MESSSSVVPSQSSSAPLHSSTAPGYREGLLSLQSEELEINPSPQPISTQGAFESILKCFIQYSVAILKR